MLSFEQKKSIFRSFSQLQEQPISYERVNYIFPNSVKRGKRLAVELHPQGNGYVNGRYMDASTIQSKGYKVDPRGWIPIKDFSEEQLREVIVLAMESMSQQKQNDMTQQLSNGATNDRDTAFKNDAQPNKTGAPSSNNEGAYETGDFVRLVRSCLYNWLGYGNLNAPIWFLGIEEGGAEIWRMGTKTLEESLRLRSEFRLQMDFCYVWEDLYSIPLISFKGPNVWRYMAAFLLELDGGNIGTSDINHYIFQAKKLGREDGNHFLGELMPLPKRNKDSIEPYSSIWPSCAAYNQEVSSGRLALIHETLVAQKNVKLIVSYNSELTDKLLRYFTPSQLVEQ